MIPQISNGVEAFKQATMNRIANAAIGGLKAENVLERDEDPAIVAESIEFFPVVYVLPIGDQPIHVDNTMGDGTVRVAYTQEIIGYYATLEKVPQENLPLYRGYALQTAALFAGRDNLAFERGVVVSQEGKVGYFGVADYIIYKFLISQKIELVVL